ncbi:hypothetical protein CATMQ487_16450 [Sphaerotilus microaerophilus]|uniref:TonB C-terminal domain-containing protein n=1 Tax=Sphaerotilus microaerophilus TaxID=2914710 RepID=A0ABN6PLK6_9BURK|nr:hypothetical protein CATMQ487_16450 [Sphaerotilus sp. FB-5]
MLATLTSGRQPPEAHATEPPGRSATAIQLLTLPARAAASVQPVQPVQPVQLVQLVQPDEPGRLPAVRNHSATPPARQPAGRTDATKPVSHTAEPFYRPNATLARPALPYSEPDWSLLDGVPASGLPLRLRLLVNARGQVDAVELLQAGPDDAALLQGLKRALLATRYIPGRDAGGDVPAAIELLIEPGAIDPPFALAKP